MGHCHQARYPGPSLASKPKRVVVEARVGNKWPKGAVSEKKKENSHFLKELKTIMMQEEICEEFMFKLSSSHPGDGFKIIGKKPWRCI